MKFPTPFSVPVAEGKQPLRKVGPRHPARGAHFVPLRPRTAAPSLDRLWLHQRPWGGERGAKADFLGELGQQKPRGLIKKRFRSALSLCRSAMVFEHGAERSELRAQMHLAGPKTTAPCLPSHPHNLPSRARSASCWAMVAASLPSNCRCSWAAVRWISSRLTRPARNPSTIWPRTWA